MATGIVALRPQEGRRFGMEATAPTSTLVPAVLAARARLPRPVCDLVALAGCLALFRGPSTALATLVISLGLGVGSLIAPQRRPVLLRAALVGGLSGGFLVLRAHSGPISDPALVTDVLMVLVVAVLSALLAEHGPNERGQLFGHGLSSRRGMLGAVEFEASLIRQRSRRHAVLAIGVDGSEPIQRLWGRSVADAVAAKVENELRYWSAGRIPLAQVDHDEFGAILVDGGPAAVRAAAMTIAAALATGPEDDVRPSVSIGWAPGGDSFTDDGRPGAVWAAAREALSQARDLGGGSVVAAGDRRYSSAGGAAGMMRRVVAACPLHAAHEPVVELAGGRVIAAVVVARPVATPADGMSALFALAREVGALPELASACRATALEGARVFPDSLPLHLGISVAAVAPVAVDDAAVLAQSIRGMGRDQATVVLDMTDAGAFDWATLAYVAAVYRGHGFRVGVDGVTDSAWAMELLGNLVPDVLKLEQSVLARTVLSAGAREEVSRLVSNASALGTQVIAKGIETDDMTERMVGLRITTGQGRRAVPDVRTAA